MWNWFILSWCRNVTIDGVWIDTLCTPLGTTSNDSDKANLHNSQFPTLPTRSFPACCVFNSRSLATTSNSGDSLALRAQVLLSQPPVQNSDQFPQSQLTTINYGIMNPILCCNCQLPTEFVATSSQLSTSASLGSSLCSLGANQA
jgi:hypothetical protein